MRVALSSNGWRYLWAQASRIVRNFKRERETFAPIERREQLEITDFRLFISACFILRNALITRIYLRSVMLKRVKLVKTFLVLT